MRLPGHIKELFYQAKRFYPELENVKIEVRYTPLTLATMMSQPTLSSFFFPWRKHKYVISVNSFKKTKRFSIPINFFNNSIIIGWFGHELAHVIQYEKMSTLQFITFPFKYLFSRKFRKKFETRADGITRQRGLEKELKEGILFVTLDSRINKAYRERTIEFYSKVN